MAFPTVVAVTEGGLTSAGTSVPVTLPSPLSTTDEILIIADLGSTAATWNALANWTELLDENVANGLKIVRWTGSGTPGNPTFTQSASTRTQWMAYRISGADKTITPQIGTTATGTSVSPDPPAITPTGGTAKDYLSIAFFGMAGEEADDDTWANTPPTNYTPSPPRQKTGGTAGTNIGGLIAAAERQINQGTAIDPGTFNVDVSAAWRAQHILVHPSPPVITIGRSPTSLTFTGLQGGANPADKTFLVTNNGSGGSTLNYSITDNQTWLSVSPTSGTETSGGAGDTITVSVNTSGLSVGTYNGTITITDAAATNSPQTVAVTLNVTQPKTISEDRYGLSAISEPATRTDHKLVARVRKTNAAHTASVRLRLYEGGTARSTLLDSGNVTTTVTEYPLAVANGDAASITDYSNLRFSLEGYSSTGDAATLEVSDVWLEAPSPAAGGGPVSKSGSEAFAFSEGVIVLTTSPGALESHALSESATVAVSPAVTDALAVSETASLAPSISATEAHALNEALSVAVTTAASEAHAMSEAAANSASLAVVDSFAFTDASAASFLLALSASDSFALTEAKVLELATALSDAFAMTEAIAAQALAAASDSATFTDTASVSADAQKTASEALALAESATIAATAAAIDSLALSEAYDLTAQHARVDTWTLAESIAAQMAVAATDAATLTETSDTGGTSFKEASDSAVLSDQATIAAALIANDAAALAEAAGSTAIEYKTAFDSFVQSAVVQLFEGGAAPEVTLPLLAVISPWAAAAAIEAVQTAAGIDPHATTSAVVPHGAGADLDGSISMVTFDLHETDAEVN